MKSLKGTSASFRAEHTSEDEQVIHSTKVGYKAITCAHVLASTAIKNRTVWISYYWPDFYNRFFFNTRTNKGTFRCLNQGTYRCYNIWTGLSDRIFVEKPDFFCSSSWKPDRVSIIWSYTPAFLHMSHSLCFLDEELTNLR